MKPPAEIDGAKVLEWAWSAPDPFFIMPYSDQPGGIPIHGLAICRYEASGTIYRFSCNKEWESENDSPHHSIESARGAESVDYEVRKIKWQRWSESDETS